MALPTATAYLSSADADTYFATSFNNAAWTALSAADKSIALAEATRYLEGLCWQDRQDKLLCGGGLHSFAASDDPSHS
jgi:hypothetical protein